MATLERVRLWASEVMSLDRISILLIVVGLPLCWFNKAEARRTQLTFDRLDADFAKYSADLETHPSKNPRENETMRETAAVVHKQHIGEVASIRRAKIWYWSGSTLVFAGLVGLLVGLYQNRERNYPVHSGRFRQPRDK